MEVVDGNGEHSIDGNEDQVVKEIDDNDSCTVDLEANGGQEPNIRMEFDSQENTYSFYTHAKSVGFGISIKNSRRSKISREFIDVSYACTRYGKKQESQFTKSTSFFLIYSTSARLQLFHIIPLLGVVSCWVILPFCSIPL